MWKKSLLKTHCIEKIETYLQVTEIIKQMDKTIICYKQI